MFTTFRNAWKIADLRKRIIFTLIIIVLYRLGSTLPLPFVEVKAMAELVSQNEGNLIGFVDFMTGGAFSNASLFALGVQPYINASIIMQLLAVAIPYLERLRKEGPEGQRKFNRITRWFGAALSLVLGFGYYLLLRNTWVQTDAGYLNGLVYGSTATMFSQIFAAVAIILSFTAGAMLLMWLGEQIDQRGIGNGISMLIFAGIVARFSSSGSTIAGYLGLAPNQPSIYIWLVVVAVLALAAVVLVIILNAAERRIPVQYAKRVVGRKMYGGQSSHIPIKVNMSGVMPIIFASSLATIPATITQFISVPDTGFWAAFFKAFTTQGWVYAIIYTLLIVAFNYFYVAITYNPIEMANNLKKNNGAIPGIRPGKPTSDFIARVIGKITLVGAIFLIVVAVGPIILANLSGMNIAMGGTSLLIMVGVALDTSRSLESFMLMRHHKGFLE